MEPNFLDMDDSEFEKAGAEIKEASTEASTATNKLESEEYEEVEETSSDYGDDDPEALLNQLFEPINADGLENFQLQNIAEAKQLIQQGLKYNSQQAKYKPQQKLIKMLEKNDLLDENKLSYLIDLASGNQDAISKLLIDNNLDPLDIDMSEEVSYQGGRHIISDAAVALDEVLADLRNSSTHDKTMEVVTTKWDESSRNALVQNPNLLRVIDMHMGNGIYDLVNARIQRERVMGNLQPGSDFDQYMHYGEVLMKEGALEDYFDNDNKPKPVERISRAPEGAVALDDQRRKAAPTRGGRTKPVKRKEPTANDFLNMSEEEFLKFSES